MSQTPRMEDLVAMLNVTADLILKFVVNLKKTPRDRRSPAHLTTRTALLEQYWGQYLANYMLFSRIPEASSHEYLEEDLFQPVQDNYLDAKTIIATWMTDQPHAGAAPPGQAGQPVPATGKLPTLDLPKFSGELREWESFRDLFVAIVDKHPGLSAAVKLQYLKANISGEADQLLRNLSVTNANYQVAWNALVDRYDNPRILIQNHIKTLLSLPACGKESAAAIKKLLDSTNESIRALTNLEQPVEHWNAILVHLTCQRLDPHTRRDWETSLGDARVSPTWTTLSTFLETRTRALEAAHPSVYVNNNNTTTSTQGNKSTKSSVSTHTVTTGQSVGSGESAKIESSKGDSTKKKGRKCPLCSDSHYVGGCAQYKAFSPPQRDEQVRRLRLCRNCLSQGHLASACPSPRKCNVCAASHHTTLHGVDQRPAPIADNSTPSSARVTADQPSMSTSLQVNHTHAATTLSPTILLGTARVVLTSESGRRVPARILIDPCAEGCFASEAKAQALRAPRTPALVPVSGVAGAKAGVSTSIVTLVVSSRTDPSVKISVDACVLPRVTADLPSRAASKGIWPHISRLELADPDFHRPGKIDMILGADVYRDLIMSGVRVGPPGTPIAQQTIFGWILTGSASPSLSLRNQIQGGLGAHHCATGQDLTALVRMFWELEEPPSKRHLTDEDQMCESLFSETHRRDSTGRYTVRLPLRKDPAGNLGDSREFACRALVRGERRRETQPAIAAEYSRFLNEYLELGHMESAPVVANADSSVIRYYMPHHSVAREVSGKSKLRVVFNASHATTTGYSLNDLLAPGPKLQTDLVSILTRWRRHRIVFAADIVKMFRQIRVDPQDCDLQRIVWRESPTAPIQDMRLLTVTYGTTCAPYLAIRTLHQLASDEAHRFPTAAEAIRHDTYVDDTLTGADDLHAAAALKTSLIEMLRCGGFELGKWTSNTPELLSDSSDSRSCDLPIRLFEPEDWIRTLGVVWKPSTDTFGFKMNLNRDDKVPTKRTLLSELARTFDPLGWAAPVLVRAKILFQDSWISAVSWDEPLPSDLSDSWQQLRASLPILENIAIPRWLGLSTFPLRYELHGFSDASERAYACAVYARATREDGISSVSLLCAKSKVAPVKTVSLPRLELCGAVLLARVMTAVREALPNDLADTSFAWSDSTVVLAWLRGHPSRWVTFVANRVSEVCKMLPETEWRHVRSSQNPADLAPRGISPEELRQSRLWWQGPEWLQQPASEWPSSASTSFSTTELERRVERHVHTVASPVENDILTRFSSLQRLLRITAWCLRIRQQNGFKRVGAKREVQPLRAIEISNARQRWISITQEHAFPEELRSLRKNQPLSPRSPLIRLTPFLDEAGTLRLGGRLQQAVLSFNERHPVILPGSGKFVELLLGHAHQVTLHGGPQLMLSYLLRFVWILGARKRVRSTVHHCVECTRQRAATPQQLMGQLPSFRVNKPSRPFEKTGLDYAGPFSLRASAGRGRATFKAYVALFVCLSSRAVHLEVVGSYETSSFLAAFKRFTARRGICAELYSDNGTNFRGADGELRSMFLAASAASKEIAAVLANDGTQWHFIPPQAPHFGGIWEAGVKSAKHHLRRVISETILTYEELATITAQIESCLNSRPICPLSANPSDLVALTPGHFLIGGAPTTPPEPSTLHLPIGRMKRWQLTTNMLESFWTRWSSEYLHHLQQRNRWTKTTQNVATGDLVLLRDDRYPPSKWPLARVTEIHPGPDGLIRVVTVKTASSSFRRPIVKLVRLPVRETEDSKDQVQLTSPQPLTAGGSSEHPVAI